MCFLFVLRVFAFDEQKNKFFLVAQSQYLQRCVLTVSHVIDFLAGDRPLVMLFAGDTAGRISCWDVTFLLLSHIRQCCKSSIEYGVENLHTTLESVTVCHSEESVTTDRSKAVEDDQNSNTEKISSKSCNNGGLTVGYMTDLEEDENMVDVMVNSLCEKHTEKTESKKFVDDQPLAGKGYVSHFAPARDAKENAVSYDTSNQSTPLTEMKDNQTLNTTFKDQSDFSCLPLACTFLAPPSHMFDAHQSGVNAISLVKMKGKAKRDCRCMVFVEVRVLLVGQGI